MYAAGKIPGSFFRREGRPGEEAILTCRLTDRPLRPSFPADFRNEVQVIATILGADQVNPHDIASINGASAALTVSGIPFNGPIGAVRLAHFNGEWIAHPTFQEGDESTFEIVVAGRRLDDGDVAIMMVEAGGTERTWELYEEGAPKITEELIAEGLEASKQWIGAAIDLQIALHAEYVLAHGPIADVAYTPNIDYTPEVFAAVSEHAKVKTAEAMAIADKNDRNDRLDEIKDDLLIGLVGTDEIPGKLAGEGTAVKRAFRSLQKEVTRSRIVNEGIRIDGRGPADLRPLSAETSVLPTSHGDGLFQRGETQVLVGRDARHAPHGADARHDHARRPQALHAPLQLPAVLDRRDRTGGLAQASRDRSRRARRACARAGDPDEARVAVHVACGLRRACVERFHVDGIGVRLDACR